MMCWSDWEGEWAVLVLVMPFVEGNVGREGGA